MYIKFKLLPGRTGWECIEILEYQMIDNKIYIRRDNKGSYCSTNWDSWESLKEKSEAMGYVEISYPKDDYEWLDRIQNNFKDGV